MLVAGMVFFLDGIVEKKYLNLTLCRLEERLTTNSSETVQNWIKIFFFDRDDVDHVGLWMVSENKQAYMKKEKTMKSRDTLSSTKSTLYLKPQRTRSCVGVQFWHYIRGLAWSKDWLAQKNWDENHRGHWGGSEWYVCYCHISTWWAQRR